MKNRRSLVIINPTFQYRFIFKLLFVVLAAFLLINLCLMSLFLFTPVDWLQEQRNLYLAVSVGVIELLSLALLFFFARSSSHRISGPAHKIDQALQKMAQGDLSVQVWLRQHDAFEDLAQSFNHTAATLREDIRRVQVRMEQFLESLPPDSEERKKAAWVAEGLAKYTAEERTSSEQ